MLNNQADSFFMVPMQTSIRSGNGVSGDEMPAPRLPSLPPASDIPKIIQGMFSGPSSVPAPKPIAPPPVKSSNMPMLIGVAAVAGLLWWKFAK